MSAPVARRSSKSPPPKSPAKATAPPRKAGLASPSPGSRPPGASPGRGSSSTRRSSGGPVYAGPTAAQRCAKLRAIMAPSEAHAYGLSSNSLSVKLDVHLNVFIQFLNSGGCPDKMDPTTGAYAATHLRRLVEWIDAQPDPPPPKLMIIREGSESRASSNGSATGRGSIKRGSPTPLDDFLEAIDEKLLVYAERLVALGVTRAGDIVNLTIEQLVGAGVKKIHARRLKSDPAVFLDAQEMALEEEGGEAGEEEEEEDPRAGWGDENTDGNGDGASAGEIGGELEALLKVAEKLGMSGADVARAKQALARKKRPPRLFAWLEELNDAKLLAYGEVLAATLGCTRPGHLAALSLDDMVAAGVKKLHARRLKTEPAVYHDAVALEEEGVAEEEEEDDDEDADSSVLHDKIEGLLSSKKGLALPGAELARARLALDQV